METAHSSAAAASAEKRRATFPTPITVTSVALKKGKPDTRALYARRYRNSNSLHDFDMLFVFEKTTRDFDRWRFVLEPGCRISDETGEYECTVIDHYPHPKHPMVQARLLNPQS